MVMSTFRMCVLGISALVRLGAVFRLNQHYLHLVVYGFTYVTYSYYLVTGIGDCYVYVCIANNVLILSLIHASSLTIATLLIYNRISFKHVSEYVVVAFLKSARFGQYDQNWEWRSMHLAPKGC